MHEKQNYYQILGISIEATQEEIKKAYRKMAMKYHPDLSQEVDAEEMMKKINEAYETLSNIEKRKVYDNKNIKTENSKAYESYTKSKEESEEDLEEWLKNYLKIKRTLNKLINEYVKLVSRNIRAQKYDVSISYNDNGYSILLVEGIARTFEKMYVNVETHPEKILEYLLNEIKSLAETIEYAASEFRRVPEETKIKTELFMAELALFQKKYIQEGKIGYESALKYISKRYLKLQESDEFYKRNFAKIPYFNVLLSEILESIMKNNQEAIKRLIDKQNKKGYK